MNAEKKEAVSGECLVSTPSNTPLFLFFSVCVTFSVLSLSLCVLYPLTFTTTKRLYEHVHMCMTERQSEKGSNWSGMIF